MSVHETKNQTPRTHLDDNVLAHARHDSIRIGVDQTVGEALESIRRNDTTGRIVYFYVVDDENRLKGVVPTRRLLLSALATPVCEIMVDEVITLPDSATLLDACEMFLFHRLLALPVVDEQGRLRGIVDVETYTDEMSYLARRAESDDVFQLIGVHVAEVRKATLPGVFRRRFPWLLCNVAGGLTCALLAGLFEATLDEIVILALFIPVVLALAESVSIQTVTLTLQIQHQQVFRRSELLGRVVRELAIGALLGLACGAIVGAMAWAWQGQVLVAVCILLSIMFSIVTAAALGLLVPTLMTNMQRDPKVASGPITLALTDLATLFYYLGLATWLLR